MRRRSQREREDMARKKEIRVKGGVNSEKLKKRKSKSERKKKKMARTRKMEVKSVGKLRGSEKRKK